jgi:hypothetical protein
MTAPQKSSIAIMGFSKLSKYEQKTAQRAPEESIFGSLLQQHEGKGNNYKPKL